MGKEGKDTQKCYSLPLNLSNPSLLNLCPLLLDAWLYRAAALYNHATSSKGHEFSREGIRTIQREEVE